MLPPTGMLARPLLDRAADALFSLAAIMVFALLPASRVRAHGDPPEAFSIVASDEDGATLIRLNEGMALRSEAGFRYLCPALWGEDTVAPAHSIPDGPAVIGAGTGLFLVTAEGAVTRHPDPAAAGRVIALAGSAGGLFALRVSGDLYQVLRVHPDSVEVLAGGTEPWDDLAASDDRLQIVRLQGGEVHERHLALAGEVIGEGSAAVPADSAAVYARLSGSSGYVLVLASSLFVELGRIEQGSWRLLQDGRSVAGPSQTEDGELFIGVDGALARFDQESVQVLDEAARITCLRRHFGVAYACSDRGLRAIDSNGLAAVLFELDELIAPDYAAIPAEQRDACMLQWERYAIDLRSVGIGASPPDAGSDAATDDAGAPPDASAEAGPDADAGARAEPGSDCACALAGVRGDGAPAGVQLGALALLLLRRLRTARQRPCRRRRTS